MLGVALALVLSAAPAPAASFDPFEDVTARAGVAFAHVEGSEPLALPQTTGPGLCFRDLDGDALPDLVLVQGAGRDDVRGGAASPFAYYRNNGDGTFADRTRAAGLTVAGWGMGALAADLDSDGDQDLVFSFYGRSPAAFENLGDGAFRPLALPPEPRPGVPWETGMAALDSEARGLLDLYAVSYLSYSRDTFTTRPVTVEIRGTNQPRTLSPFAFSPRHAVFYRNRGGPLAFEERAKPAGLSNKEGKGLAAMVVDVNRDGLHDLFVANDITPCALYQSGGDGTFTDVAAASWVADVAGSMGLALADYDHDGLLDVFSSRWVQEPHGLYRANARKQGPLYFTNMSEASGLTALGANQVGWGCAFLDVNGDGWEDLFIANGHTYLAPRRWVLERLPAVVMLSDGRGHFARLAAPPGSVLNEPLCARGAAFADLDNDLAVDVALIENRGPAHLWRARGAAGNALALELVGTRANRDAIGAEVTVRTPSTTLTRMVTSGDSYLSTSSKRLTFRLGDAMTARVTVRWGREATQELGELAAGRVVRVVEPW